MANFSLKEKTIISSCQYIYIYIHTYKYIYIYIYIASKKLYFQCGPSTKIKYTRNVVESSERKNCNNNIDDSNKTNNNNSNYITTSSNINSNKE